MSKLSRAISELTVAQQLASRIEDRNLQGQLLVKLREAERLIRSAKNKMD